MTWEQAHSGLYCLLVRDKTQGETNKFSLYIHTHTHTYIYIYRERERERERERGDTKNSSLWLPEKFDTIANLVRSYPPPNLAIQKDENAFIFTMCSYAVVNQPIFLHWHINIVILNLINPHAYWFCQLHKPLFFFFFFRLDN